MNSYVWTCKYCGKIFNGEIKKVNIQRKLHVLYSHDINVINKY